MHFHGCTTTVYFTLGILCLNMCNVFTEGISNKTGMSEYIILQ